MIYNLKCVQPYYNDVYSGKKQFELRKDDRVDFYRVGDVLILHEYVPYKNCFTGSFVCVAVKYVLKNCQEYGLKPGF